MSIGYFLDKEHQPSEKQIETALGSNYRLWKTLIEFIAENYQIPPEINFGGNKYGWNLWYRKSGKSLVSIFPQQNYFVAQVVLGKDQVEEALKLKLGKKVGRLVKETPQLHDGKWLFIPVASQEEVDDVEKLLLLKRSPIKKKV